MFRSLGILYSYGLHVVFVLCSFNCVIHCFGDLYCHHNHTIEFESIVGSYVIFRERYVIFRERYVIFRERCVIFRERYVIFRERCVIFRERYVIFWERYVIFRERCVIFRERYVIFRERYVIFRERYVIFRERYAIFRERCVKCVRIFSCLKMRLSTSALASRGFRIQMKSSFVF